MKNPPSKQETERHARMRAHLEASLSMLESYIQDLWRFLPLPICYVNPVHKILDVNTTLAELIGVSAPSLVGTSVLDLMEDKNQAQKIGLQILSQNRYIAEATIKIRAGSSMPVRLYSQFRKDEAGESIGYFLAFVDTTQEKKFEEELKREVEKQTKELQDTHTALMNMLEDTEEARKQAEEDRNRTNVVMENFPDGLIVLDAEDRLEVVNSEAARMFRVKEREIAGKSLQDIAQISSIKPLLELIQEKGSEFLRIELAVRSGNVFEVSAIPLVHGGRHKGTIVALHDISREKQVEQLKTEFVSLAAHQLRTPLSAIKWTLTMLLGGDMGEISQQQRTLLEKTERSNERMINLINDLLDVTRIEEGRYVHSPQFARIEELLKSMVESFQERAESQNLTLTSDLPDSPLPRVLIDDEKIQLVLQNFLENSFNYTPEGGSITVSARNEGDHIVVAVKDTGIGIPEKEQRRVFQKFFRASNAKRVDTEGSGLGLYLVKNIIEAHEGKIWFESEEGKGTTISFSLPVKQEMEEFLKKF